MVLPNTALHLKALLDFEDKNGDKVVAGDEWLFEGPGKFFLTEPGSGSEASCLPMTAPMASIFSFHVVFPSQARMFPGRRWRWCRSFRPPSSSRTRPCG